MSAIEIYAIAATILAAWFGFGWYMANNVLKDLCDVEAADWPAIRGLLRQSVKGKK